MSPNKKTFKIVFNWGDDLITFHERTYTENQALVFALNRLESQLGYTKGVLYARMITGKKFTITEINHGR